VMSDYVDWRTTPLTFRQRWSVRMKWEKRDLWIGAYYERGYPRDPRDPQGRQCTTSVRTYICIVPCSPIIVERLRGESP
jgi:hypothetical protein